MMHGRAWHSGWDMAPAQKTAVSKPSIAALPTWVLACLKPWQEALVGI